MMALRDVFDATVMVRKLCVSLKAADPGRWTKLANDHPKVIAECVTACEELLELLRNVSPDKTAGPE
jgi:hypothetical protein